MHFNHLEKFLKNKSIYLNSFKSYQRNTHWTRWCTHSQAREPCWNKGYYQQTSTTQFTHLLGFGVRGQANHDRLDADWLSILLGQCSLPTGQGCHPGPFLLWVSLLRFLRADTLSARLTLCTWWTNGNRLISHPFGRHPWLMTSFKG